MATGIEMMFSKLIGLTPEQLKEMATGFVASVNSINERLGTIERQVGELHALTQPELIAATHLEDKASD